MRVSIQLPTCTEGLVNPVPFAVAPDDFVRIAQAAERLGYDGVWGNDHITAAPYVKQHWSDAPNFYEVLMTLATVGAHTRRVHLGTAVMARMRNATVRKVFLPVVIYLALSMVLRGLGIHLL